MITLTVSVKKICMAVIMHKHTISILCGLTSALNAAAKVEIISNTPIVLI